MHLHQILRSERREYCEHYSTFCLVFERFLAMLKDMKIKHLWNRFIVELKAFIHKKLGFKTLIFALLFIIITPIVIVKIVQYVKVNSFFQEYSVLTASGEGMFSYNKIKLDGKVIQETSDNWTNVLPIYNSLKYVLMTSTYAHGKDINCGGQIIPKRIESDNSGENDWCINHNGKSIIAISPAQYMPYDEANILYEKCLMPGYYEFPGGNGGRNSCATRGLFWNDKKIAETKEAYEISMITGKRYLDEASSFNYYPSKRIGEVIVYSTNKNVYTYNIKTEETKQFSDRTLEDIFLIDETPVAIYSQGPNEDGSLFLGKANYNGKDYSNILSAAQVDNHLYFLIVSRTEKSGNDTIFSYSILKDGIKIANTEVRNYDSYISYSPTKIALFPYCDYDAIVCLYEDGHFAFKKSIPLYQAFDNINYESTSYVSEMIVDNKEYEHHIPDMISRSKPIFENGELKMIIYTGMTKGLFALDVNKNWDFNLSKGSGITKLLGGYQNKLLNVLEK